jgi:hypothetical protein
MDVPKHPHILQAYPRLDFEFLPTLAAVVLNRQEREPSRWLRSLLDKNEKVPYLWPYENDN